MSNQPRVSHQDAVEVWQDVLSRAFQVFSYYHWHFLEGAYVGLCQDQHSLTVRNAALESSLMSIRDLDDFFGGNGAYADDVIAADFHFPSCGRFLTSPERDGINKKLAHLTYRSVHERRQQGANTNPKTWDFADLVGRAMQKFVDFLDYLETTFFASDPAQRSLVKQARCAVSATASNIAAMARHQLSFVA